MKIIDKKGVEFDREVFAFSFDGAHCAHVFDCVRLAQKGIVAYMTRYLDTRTSREICSGHHSPLYTVCHVRINHVFGHGVSPTMCRYLKK